MRGKISSGIFYNVLIAVEYMITPPGYQAFACFPDSQSGWIVVTFWTSWQNSSLFYDVFFFINLCFIFTISFLLFILLYVCSGFFFLIASHDDNQRLCFLSLFLTDVTKYLVRSYLRDKGFILFPNLRQNSPSLMPESRGRWSYFVHTLCT